MSSATSRGCRDLPAGDRALGGGRGVILGDHAATRGRMGTVAELDPGGLLRTLSRMLRLADGRDESIDGSRPPRGRKVDKVDGVGPTIIGPTPSEQTRAASE